MLASGGNPLLGDGLTWQLIMCGNSLVFLCWMVWIHCWWWQQIQIPSTGSYPNEWLRSQQLWMWFCMLVQDVLAFFWSQDSITSPLPWVKFQFTGLSWQWLGLFFWKFEDKFDDIEYGQDMTRIWPYNVPGHILKIVLDPKVIEDICPVSAELEDLI